MQVCRPYREYIPRLHKTTYIDPTSVIIGHVILEENVSIWPLAVIRGDVNHIVIGTNTNIQDGSILHVSRPSQDNPNGFPLIIGNDVTIGHKVMLHGCQIGHRTLVGMGSIILDGVIIEDEVMIGAGSLIPPMKHLESGFLYIGSPVKKIRPLTDTEILQLKASADHYVRLKDEYLIMSN